MNKQRNHSKKKNVTHKVWFNILLLCLTFACLLGTRLYINHPITGDEPHYLLMDYSLVHDGDFNLRNNYQDKNYLKFYPGLLTPLEQVGTGQDNSHSPKQYSIHTIGLPLLVAPGFLIDGEWGVVVEMVMIATLVVWLTWVWTKRLTKNRTLAYIAAACLGACFSFNALAGYIYPDMAIAATLLAALIIIDGYYDRWAWQLLFGFLVGFLVLLHFKTLAMVAPLLLIIVYKNWRHNRQLPWLVLVGTAPLIGYFFVSLHEWFGLWNPSKVYGQGYSFASPPAPIVSGILFDSVRGLLVNNPIIYLVFVGLPIWFKRNRESCLTALVATLPFMGILALFRGWQGGDSSMGRYTIAFLPVLMPAIAFAAYEFRQLWQKIIAALAFTATLCISLDDVITKWPYPRVETISPLFQQIQNRTGLALNHLFPTFSSTNSPIAVATLMYQYGVLKLVVDYTVLVILCGYGIFLSRSAVPLKKTKN